MRNKIISPAGNLISEDLDSKFSNASNIIYNNLTYSEILHYKTKDGITKFRKRIKIGKYSNFWLPFRTYQKIFSIEEFKTILIELNLAQDQLSADKFCDMLNGDKVSWTQCGPDYLHFDIVNNGKSMRIRQFSWD